MRFGDFFIVLNLETQHHKIKNYLLPMNVLKHSKNELEKQNYYGRVIKEEKIHRQLHSRNSETRSR